MKNTEDLIHESKEKFESILHKPEYRVVHGDDSQLEKLILLLGSMEGKSFLDLGTGDGYVAFEIAKRCKSCHVTGVDIASAAIVKNNNEKIEYGLKNIEFMEYGGTKLPFDDNQFNGATCRYAFHHFPEPHTSVKELYRVLKPNGLFLISDPVPVKEDNIGFINKFQRLNPDGHIRYYPKHDLIALCEKEGFYHLKSFTSSITYSRPQDLRYNDLFSSTPQHLKNAYNIEVKENQVWITVQVSNSLFGKS